MQSNFWAGSKNLDRQKHFGTCKRTRHKFGYQNSLMLCSCVKLLGSIGDVQFLNFISDFKLEEIQKED